MRVSYRAGTLSYAPVPQWTQTLCWLGLASDKSAEFVVLAGDARRTVCVRERRVWAGTIRTATPHSSLRFKPAAPHALLWPAEPRPSNMADTPTMH